MYEINLKGTYHEMGIRYGQRLKESEFKIPKISKKNKNLALKCREYVISYFPGYLEELEGIAEAANLNYEDLCAFSLIIPNVPSCSIFAIHKGETTWLGRNYDMYYSFKEHLESTFCEPLDQYRSIGHSDIFVGREDGINEKGLAIAQAGIATYHKPGLSFWVVIRYILDKCASVEEATNFIKKVPHYCTTSYLLADQTRTIRIIEIGPKDRLAIRKPEIDFIIATNHYLHPSLNRVKIYIPPDSHSRYNRVYNGLVNSPDTLNETYFENLLSDHDGLVCSHRDHINLGTLWSVVYNLNNLKIWRASGHPCSNPYLKDERLRSSLKI